jgi:hypothetical protein
MPTMTRSQVLSAGMLRQRNPDYQPLSYGRWLICESIRDELLKSDPDASGHVLRGCQWVICTRSEDDAELVAALAAEDRVAALRPLWIDKLHVSDASKFSQWWDDEIAGNEAAATSHRPDSRLGKSESSEEPSPTT